MANFSITNILITCKQKNKEIQVLRAIAIIAVVLIHTAPTEGLYQVFIRPFINFSVPLFLFLSGYLTKSENDNWPSFYKKRITRIVIPYIIWTVIYCLVKRGSIISAPRAILTAGAAVPFYYIFVYVQLVLLTPLIGALAKSKYRSIGWLVAPVSMLIFKYPPIFTGIEFSPSIDKIWSLCFLSHFTFYYLGMVLGNHIIEINYSYKKLLASFSLSILLQMAEGFLWYQRHVPNLGTQCKITALLTSSIFLLILSQLLRDKKITTNKTLQLLGDYSFGVYLIHPLLIFVLEEKQSLFPYTSIPFIINTAIIIIICFLICHCGRLILGPKTSKWLGFI